MDMPPRPRGARRLAAALAAGLLATPALAQPQQDWFVPPGGQPGGQGAPPAARPAPPAQPRPAQAQPARPQPPPRQPQALPALPPGQQTPTPVIGIVDVPEVQRVSQAFAQVRDEIERRRQKLNEDLQREQTSWREQQQQLANQRASLAPEQLRTRERELQDRITDSQRIFRDRSRGIEQSAQGALVEIEQALGAVIRQVAASRKVNLVLPRPLVIFNDPPFDLTEEVSQQFNKVLTRVSLPAEDAPPAQAQSAPRPAGGRAAPAAPPAAPPAGGEGPRRTP